MNEAWTLEQMRQQPLDQALLYAVSGIRDYSGRAFTRLKLIEEQLQHAYANDTELQQQLQALHQDLEGINNAIATLLLDALHARLRDLR